MHTIPYFYYTNFFAFSTQTFLPAVLNVTDLVLVDDIVMFLSSRRFLVMVTGRQGLRDFRSPIPSRRHRYLEAFPMKKWSFHVWSEDTEMMESTHHGNVTKNNVTSHQEIFRRTVLVHAVMELLNTGI